MYCPASAWSSVSIRKQFSSPAAFPPRPIEKLMIFSNKESPVKFSRSPGSKVFHTGMRTDEELVAIAASGATSARLRYEEFEEPPPLTRQFARENDENKRENLVLWRTRDGIGYYVPDWFL